MQVRSKFKKSIHVFNTAPSDASECFVYSNCAIYLLRLLDKFPVFDREVLQMAAWVLGADIRDAFDYLMGQMSERERSKFDEDMEDLLDDSDEISRAIARILKKTRRSIAEKFYSHLCHLLKIRADGLKHRSRSEDEKKLARLKRIFNLTEQECDFCRFQYIISTWRKPAEFFGDHLDCNALAGRKYLSAILQVTERELTKVLEGTLSRIDFYEMDKYSLDIKDEFLEFFRQSSAKWLTSHLFRTVSRKTIPLECHLVEARQTDHVLNLLKAKRNEPVHILLYGPAGTGKTSYALGIAKRLGVQAYEILREQENKSCNRRAAIIACLKMTNSGNGSLIIVDEADNLLNTGYSWFRLGETQDKGWLNQLLEEPNARMIWITNDTDMIEESVLRRFAFSLPFRPFNRRQRMQMCESVLRQNKIIKHFSNEEIAGLVKKYAVSGGIIDMAVKKARLTCAPSNNGFKDAVIMALDAFLALRNGGIKIRNREGIEKNYSLEGLNVEGDIGSMMDQVTAFDRSMQERHDDENRNFNLLFYGPPGTGKSEMARYIAEHLGRQLIVKRLSDILDCYVGETEKKIAAIFYEAEHNDAVLVIDEADSILFSRERAVRSWEISHTNEFLTQMERFRGILICTTNRLTDLDNASIRRFNCKMGFRYLEPAGNIIFYRKMLSVLTTEPMNVTVEAELKTLTDLAPGDFRIVRDRYSICPPEKVTHRLMTNALTEESAIKMVQQGKKHIGFS